MPSSVHTGYGPELGKMGLQTISVPQRPLWALWGKKKVTIRCFTNARSAFIQTGDFVENTYHLPIAVFPRSTE